MKNTILFFLLFFSIGSQAQSLPTMLSYQIDTLCNSDFDFAIVHSIQIQDLNADSTYLTLTSWNGGFFYNIAVSTPAFVPGQTIRTFSITVDPGTGLAPGLNLSNISFTASGNIANDGGSTTGLTITNVAAYGTIVATLDLTSLSLCSNDNPIDIRPYASPAGGTFDWTGETSYMFDPEVFYSNSGTDLYYYYTNSAGCVGNAYSLAPIINPAPFVSMSASYSTCGNSDGSIFPFVSASSLPVDIYWSTGFSETIMSVATDQMNLPAGNYYMNVTDANGCKAVGLGQVYDVEVDISESITDETCAHMSQDGSATLTINSSLGTVNSIYWSNGQTTSTLSNVSKGEYLVEVTTDAGCKAGKSIYIDGGAIQYAENVNSMDASCSNSDGIIDIDVLGGSGSYSYLWNTGATSQDLFGVPSGTYSCVITDMSTGCVSNFDYDVFSSGGPGISLNYINKPTCGSADGEINLNVFTWSAPIANISWSSGHTTADLENIPAGSYEITVTALDGCILHHTIDLENELPENPQICMLTVDTSLIYNMIVWEKDLTQTQIAGYNIYREMSTYGLFELVAQRPYALESFYQDNDASPMDRSWRYYLTAYDNCGNESAGSYIHKTIHTVTTTTNSIDYVVHWDEYEGLNYTDVEVFRYDATAGWTSIGNFIYGTNSATDSPLIQTDLDYLVQFNLTDPCTSTKVQDYNSSRSNKTASVFNPGGSTVQIEDADLGIVSIYPNPADHYFVIHIDQIESITNFEILDLNGNIIQRSNLADNNTYISTSGMAAGVYLVKIYSEEKVITQKLVLN